jgi:hypothetical protein
MLSSGEYKGILRYSTVLQLRNKIIQRARYEQFILKNAESYAEYRIYFPAFMDGL